MIVNFENAASHNYVVQKGKNLWRLLQKWLGIHVLFLSKIQVNSVLNIPVALRSEWMPQGQYRSVRYNNDDTTTDKGLCLVLTLSSRIFFCHNHQTAVFCVIFKKVLFKIWKSRVWGRNGPGTYTMCLLRSGGTNRYHHAQHIMSVDTHMYQLHYYIKSVGTRAVESEVSSSDSNSYLDSGQFWLSDSNSDSGPTPTLSRITYLEW